VLSSSLFSLLGPEGGQLNKYGLKQNSLPERNLNRVNVVFDGLGSFS
jgi:hypothetical protein